jgi:hypothetical protein
MNFQALKSFLGWCTFINFLFIILSWLVFIFAHDFAYKMWANQHNLTVEMYDAIYISIIGFYKIITVAFMLVPYLVLRLKK